MRRDLSSGFHGTPSRLERSRSIHLGEGYVMAEVKAPHDFVGIALREPDLRANHGVEGS